MINAVNTPRPRWSAAPGGTPPPRPAGSALLEGATAWPALRQAVVMLRPDLQWNNPVMFVVEVGAVLTLGYIVEMALGYVSSLAPITYFIALDAWLFLTVLFANFATSLAEARGRARADSLRQSRRDTTAQRRDRGRRLGAGAGFPAGAGRRGGGGGGPVDPRRRGDHRRRGRGERIRHHRRIGPGDPGRRSDRSGVTGAPWCSRTGSKCASPPARANPSWTG